MIIRYILSSVVGGIVATIVMLAALNISNIWGVKPLDVRAMFGSFITKKIDKESRLLGLIILLAGGIIFSFLYGIIVLGFITGRFGGTFGLPEYNWIPGVNFFYLYLGFLGGFGHGTFMALIGGAIIYELHPLEEFRKSMPYIVAALIGHAVFGFTVMLVHNFILARGV
ncbi:MAG TPA: hypothetical protein ENK21_06635 [Trueperaceae bacterium]|nr:hypothetical protein [Trueperaceae bacterium]